ncbi:Alphaherpesvirus glycoprotein E/Wnt and FGF inhibitory regulator [Novymonas esmeraldas]|uniref:Alphaherpesvirus glycoprotein E/Wnt and FGF inhibitory regulator n=1 Tax=Novymonas esmeraldas TaxID=1808958 RepID=A0AAW0FED0_9TRYP
MFTASPRRARLVGYVVLATLLSLALVANAEVVVFITDATTTPSGGSDLSKLRAACATTKADAIPMYITPTTNTTPLFAAITEKGATEMYVGAMYTTVPEGSLWMWQDPDSSIVTGNAWAPGYPTGDMTLLKYAVYSSNLGSMTNVDGTKPLPVACTYGSEAPPVEEQKPDKKAFPWWAILIIVLGAVIIIAVVVVVVCCCCCRRKKNTSEYDDADADADGALADGGRSREMRATPSDSGDSSSNSSSSRSIGESDAESKANRSFTNEASKAVSTPVTKGRLDT